MMANARPKRRSQRNAVSPGGEVQEIELRPLSHISRMSEVSIVDQDEGLLRRLGKKAVLKRTFESVHTIGFTVTLMITWEKMLIAFSSNYMNGGPAGAVYGFVLVFIGATSTYATLSELASMAPTNGGLYHWVGMLAPAKCQKFLGYTTGYVTTFGWQAMLASAGWFNSGIMGSLIVLMVDGYFPKTWHLMLLSCATILFSFAVNSLPTKFFPYFQTTAFALHLLGFFAILVPIVVLGPTPDLYSTFGTFLNASWPSDGLAMMVGLTGNIFSLIGADAAMHMAEEVRDAVAVVPRSIMISILLNGALGLGMVIVILLYLGPDPENIDEAGFLFVGVFHQAVGSRTGTAIMTSIVMVMNFCSTIAIMATGSRQLWAFAREKGVPGWRWISRVETCNSAPMVSLAVITVVACGQTGIYYANQVIASGLALNGSQCGLLGSYLLASILLLWRRCRANDILPYQRYSTEPRNMRGAPLSWGPWQVPGYWGIANNILTIIFLSCMWIFSFWPLMLPIDPGTMNYGAVLVVGVVTCSTLYYVFWAKKVYVGGGTEF